MNELSEELSKYLISQSAKILKCDESDINWEDDLDENGFESMQVNQLCVEINNSFSVGINPALFLEVTSLSNLSQYLQSNYYSQLETNLL